MRITVLTVPDCPNAALVRERIDRALADRDVPVASVEWIEVTDVEQAEATGMTGSPTVLVDGVDPFAPQGAVPSLSCRLYRAADDAVEGAPTVEALRRALLGGPAEREA